jgi:hypothetical protein
MHRPSEPRAKRRWLGRLGPPWIAGILLTGACKRDPPAPAAAPIVDAPIAPPEDLAGAVASAQITNDDSPRGADVRAPQPKQVRAPEPPPPPPPSLRQLGEAPSPDISSDEPDVVIGRVVNRGGILGEFERTVSRLKAGFRACYAREASEDSPDTAALTLRLSIRPSGSTRTVKSEGASGLAASTVDCVVRRAQNSTFAPPVGGEAELIIPLRFAKTTSRPVGRTGIAP